MASVVGLKLSETVGKVLSIESSHRSFWSDSMDVLYWIRTSRVGGIQALTSPNQWKYVPTRQNPADLLSRGESVSKLLTEEKWWNGPTFLKQDSTEWPETKIEVKKGPDIEARKQYQEAEQTEEQTFLALTSEDCLQPQRYSSWSKLTRVTARVDRFLENCRYHQLLEEKEP